MRDNVLSEIKDWIRDGMIKAVYHTHAEKEAKYTDDNIMRSLVISVKIEHERKKLPVVN